MKIISFKLRNQENRFIDIAATEDFKMGDVAIIKISDHLEDGEVVGIEEKKAVKEKNEAKLVRKATKTDLEKINKISQEEDEASMIFLKKIAEHNLDMKLVKTAINFDEKNLTFYFSAVTRLDFRELLKDLVRTFHKLIRLQQIGPRDEARMMAGLGPCGRELCCQVFLKKINTVPSDLAKIQKLSQISSNKISGSCGKLMCCLAYEVETYQELQKNLPKIGDKVKTKSGEGVVRDLDIINQKAKIELSKGDQVIVSYKKEADD